MKRGEVWWASFPAPAGRRPALIVSRQTLPADATRITVVELSTVIRDLPTEVRLGKAEGLPLPCVANTDNLVTEPKACLTDRLKMLPAAKVAELDAALRFALGL